MFSCEFSEISMNIFSCRTPPAAASFKAAKRILKTNVNNGKYDAMENKNKTVIHTPLTQGWLIYPLIEIWFCKKSQIPKV